MVEVIEIEGVYYEDAKPNIRIAKHILFRLASEWKYKIFKWENMYFLLTPNYIFYSVEEEEETERENKK